MFLENLIQKKKKKKKNHCVRSVRIWNHSGPSVFSRILAQYGDIICIFPYSFQMRENTIWSYLLKKFLMKSFSFCALTEEERLLMVENPLKEIIQNLVSIGKNKKYCSQKTP